MRWERLSVSIDSNVPSHMISSKVMFTFKSYPNGLIPNCLLHINMELLPLKKYVFLIVTSFMKKKREKSVDLSYEQWNPLFCCWLVNKYIVWAIKICSPPPKRKSYIWTNPRICHFKQKFWILYPPFNLHPLHLFLFVVVLPGLLIIF